jgi:vitamin B12 transporter
MNVGIQSVSRRSEFSYGNPPIEMPAYYVWNLYSTYNITKNIKAFVDFKNITDEKYSEVRGYNSRRFNFMAGVNLNF